MKCAFYIDHPAKARLRGSRSEKTESGLLSGLSREASTKRRSGISRISESIHCNVTSVNLLSNYRERYALSRIDLPAKARLRGSRSEKTESGLLSGLSREASTKRRSGISRISESTHCNVTFVNLLSNYREQYALSRIDLPAKARLRGSRSDKTESGLLSGLSREASTKRIAVLGRILKLSMMERYLKNR